MELLFDRYAVLGMMVIVSPLDHVLRTHPVKVLKKYILIYNIQSGKRLQNLHERHVFQDQVNHFEIWIS